MRNILSQSCAGIFFFALNKIYFKTFSHLFTPLDDLGLMKKKIHFFNIIRITKIKPEPFDFDQYS